MERDMNARLEAAQRAVMLEDCCGLSIAGERVFCDDPRAEEPSQDCICKRAGIAALAAQDQPAPFNAVENFRQFRKDNPE